MKEKTKQPFDIYRQGLTEDERQRLADFFVALDLHCRLPGRQARGMREDFKRAICHYAETGVPLDEALARLDAERLGGFYARPPVLWFPLDDAAKIYPISMKRNRMAVFRLSAYLDRDVVPELLQMALTFTIKRFPSFATTLKQGFFWHYLDSAKRRFRIERETDMPCRPLKVSRSGSQSFRVLYEKNRISAEFFHVLTDGVGGMTFLKALTAEYLRLEGVCARRDETLWNVEDTPCAEEFANEFARVPHSARASGFAQKAAVQMSGRLARRRPCRILHFKMDASRLKAVAGTYGATVGAYMLALMFVAGRAATDEQEGEAAIQVPVDMRKFHPSRTVRNFALYCGIRLPLQAAAGVEAVVEEIARAAGAKGVAGSHGGNADLRQPPGAQAALCSAGDKTAGGKAHLRPAGRPRLQQYLFQSRRGAHARGIRRAYPGHGFCPRRRCDQPRGLRHGYLRQYGDLFRHQNDGRPIL